MQLLGMPFEAWVFRVGGVGTRRLVELLIFVRREPRPALDLASSPVWIGEVGQVLQPAVTLGRLEHHAQGDDFIVDGVAGRCLPGLRLRVVLFHLALAVTFTLGAVVCLIGFVVALRLRHAMDAVFLNRAGGYLGDGHLAEIRHEMESNLVLVALHLFRAAAAPCDGFILFLKRLRGLGEGLAGRQLAVTALVSEGQIPVLGKILGELKALLLGRSSPVSTSEVGGALPKSAVIALIEVDFAAKYRVALHDSSSRLKMCESV